MSWKVNIKLYNYYITKGLEIRNDRVRIDRQTDIVFL